MDIRFLIEQLDEITRRGFLKGLAGSGAACGLAGCGIIEDVREGKRRFLRVRKGMSRREVDKIMGGEELYLGPKKTLESPYSERWEYNGVGTVNFWEDQVFVISYVDAPMNRYDPDEINESLARIVELSKK